TLCGFLAAIVRNDVARVVLAHVLARNAGRGLERTLVVEALGMLSVEPLGRIHVEFMPFGTFDDGIFGELGFRMARRALMFGESTSVAAAEGGRETRPLLREDGAGAAALLNAAYRDHPGRWLHPEVQTKDAAADFIEMTMQGHFGEVPPGALRV